MSAKDTYIDMIGIFKFWIKFYSTDPERYSEQIEFVKELITITENKINSIK